MNDISHFNSSLLTQLDAIPTIGSSNWLGSLWAGCKFQLNAIGLLQEGYDKVPRYMILLWMTPHAFPVQIRALQGC